VTAETQTSLRNPPPCPTREVPFAAAHVSPQARRRVSAVLSSGWLTTGTETLEFEREFASFVGARHAVAVSSCTAAIELALRALRLRKGAAVLTPTLTFCGAVHAIVHAGLRPVFVDVDAVTLVPRPDQVAAAAMRHRPAAMVVQHMAGYPAPVHDLAAAAGLELSRIVEDAAHGLGSSLDDRPVGSISAATCFSFYATKNLPIGEGGAITTADPELAAFVRSARLHGMSKDAWSRYLPGGSWEYSVENDGIKANMSDVQAAIGRGQLLHVARWQRRRATLAAEYDRLLDRSFVIDPPARPATGAHAWHLYIVRLQPGTAPTRDVVIASLAQWGVSTSVHFIPAHRFRYFRRLLGEDECATCPEADAVFPQLLSLPLHPGLTRQDVMYVCERLFEASAGTSVT
jgi:dTDP-4-amino-4,6-dideoxygalactose transaminase